MSDEDSSDAASEESVPEEPTSEESASERDDSEFGFEAQSDPDEAIDDPFAELGPGVEDRAADNPSDPDPSDADPSDSDPSATPTAPEASTAAGDDAATPTDDPFADLGPGTDVDDDLFEEMDVGAVDDVWTALDEDTGDAGDADRTGHDAASAGDEEHLVEVRSYCQQCPHFSSPPDATCTHEGTTIVEAVDFDTFRVRNCPIVGPDGPTFDDK